PTKQGFDFFYGYNCQRQAHTYFPPHLWHNETKVKLNNKFVKPWSKLPDGVDSLDLEVYTDYWLNEYAPDLMHTEAINFIKDNKEEPFFLYYASPIPHMPLQAPPRWVDYYVKKFGDEKPYIGRKGYYPCRYPKATYAAMITYLDEQVGELVAELKAQGIYENTIIMFSSDNGPAHNGGTNGKWFNSAGQFREGKGYTKGYVYEGGLRVPMIVSWPGGLLQKGKTDYISSFYDVLPTICDVAGIEIPNDVDGKSFLPIMKGKEVEEPLPHYYWEFHAKGGQQALRMGKWKALRKNLKKKGLVIELYDLEADSTEKKNVADQHPDVVKQIEKIMEQEHVESDNIHFKMKELGDNAPGDKEGK
ncbi:MAG: sulfatase-like hydrolase/transferase, partial [Bacteroidales bacterium]|nr:sulfatase-like hydrolase/transferase [Bacteroidales bacterium]